MRSSVVTLLYRLRLMVEEANGDLSSLIVKGIIGRKTTIAKG